jgi:hypothetical protein
VPLAHTPTPRSGTGTDFAARLRDLHRVRAGHGRRQCATRPASGAVCAGSNPAGGAARTSIFELSTAGYRSGAQEAVKFLLTSALTAAKPLPYPPQSLITIDLQEKTSYHCDRWCPCPASCRPDRNEHRPERPCAPGEGLSRYRAQALAESSPVPLPGTAGPACGNLPTTIENRRSGMVIARHPERTFGAAGSLRVVSGSQLPAK